MPSERQKKTHQQPWQKEETWTVINHVIIEITTVVIDDATKTDEETIISIRDPSRRTTTTTTTTEVGDGVVGDVDGFTTGDAADLLRRVVQRIDSICFG